MFGVGRGVELLEEQCQPQHVEQHGSSIDTGGR